MRVATLLLVALALALAAPGARAGTPAEDLAALNFKRAATGIPADIVENPAWSAACALHIRYMRATNTVTHDEDPASPHFTEQGNWAGTHAVLASSATWTADNFIWETAPLHLTQLLAPQLSEVGIADDGQYVCVTTWPGYLRPPPTTGTILAYPGPGLSVYSTEYSAEWPTTPAIALGLENPTGPHIYVYAWGPAAATGIGADGLPIAVRRATLVGPSGPVRVRVVDTRNPLLGRYLPNASAILVPERPLERAQEYAVTVEMTDGTAGAWTFLTEELVEDRPFSGLRFSFSPAVSRNVCVRRASARCETSKRQRFTTLRIRGRFVDTDVNEPPANLQTMIDGYGRALTTLPRGGVFDTRFLIRYRRDRQKLHVTLTVGDDLAAYVVEIKPGRDPARADLTRLIDATPPLRPVRPPTAPDPRASGSCGRTCSVAPTTAP